MRWPIPFLILGLLGGCADKVLLHPSTGPMDANGAERRMLDLGNRKIEVFVSRSAAAGPVGQPMAYVLEFCGNATRADQVARKSAERWGSRSVEVWAVNYPGYGKSDGPASLRLIRDTALETYDRLRNEAGGRPIFVSGRSLGTAVALCVAARRPVAGVVLHSAVPLQRLIIQRYGWWNLWIGASIIASGVPDELNALDNAPRVKAPAVFIISGADALVPSDYQLMVFHKYAGAKRQILLKDAAHNSPFPAEDQIWLDQDLDWLWQQAM